MSRDEKSSYYDVGGIEVFDVIKAKLTVEQFHGFLLGNAIKYQLRMNHKTPGAPERDAEKAANFSGWLSEALEQPEIETSVSSSIQSQSFVERMKKSGGLRRFMEGIWKGDNDAPA